MIFDFDNPLNVQRYTWDFFPGKHRFFWTQEISNNVLCEDTQVRCPWGAGSAEVIKCVNVGGPSIRFFVDGAEIQCSNAPFGSTANDMPWENYKNPIKPTNMPIKELDFKAVIYKETATSMPRFITGPDIYEVSKEVIRLLWPDDAVFTAEQIIKTSHGYQIQSHALQLLAESDYNWYTIV
jgi:hypothetical protein